MMDDVPLELRIGFLLVLVAYGFSLDCTVLDAHGIDIRTIFGIPPKPGDVRGTWRIANTMAGIWATGFLVFALQVNHGIQTRFVAFGTLVVLLGVILSIPMIRQILRRILVGGLSIDHRLGDILLSDTLVSCSGPLVDMALAGTLVWSGVSVLEPTADARAAYQTHWTLVAASLPLGIRIKQCILDYRRSKNKQHLLNLLKYLVGNLPHALRVQEMANPAVGRFIGPALTANALYSLVWDIVMDWRLFDNGRWHAFPQGSYTAAAVLDAILRFSFLVRSPSEVRVFELEALELVRRIGWVVLRVESEGKHATESIELPTYAS